MNIDTLFNLVSHYKYPPQHWHNIPIYSHKGRYVDNCILIRYFIKRGNTVTDLVESLHHGGDVYLNCVAFAFVVAAIVDTRNEPMPVRTDFFIARNPPFKFFPKGVVAMDIFTGTKIVQHVMYQLDDKYIHCMAKDGSNVVVSDSLDDVCVAMMGVRYPYIYTKYDHDMSGEYSAYRTNST